MSSASLPGIAEINHSCQSNNTFFTSVLPTRRGVFIPAFAEQLVMLFISLLTLVMQTNRKTADSRCCLICHAFCRFVGWSHFLSRSRMSKCHAAGPKQALTDNAALSNGCPQECSLCLSTFCSLCADNQPFPFSKMLFRESHSA